VLKEEYILAVGIRDKSEMLESVPVRVILCDKGLDALRCLKQARTRMLISKWDLPDMPDGDLLRRFTQANPYMPTIAFVEANNTEQEIEARTLGVTCVLADDTNYDEFFAAVCQVLELSSIKQLQLMEHVTSEY